MPVVTIHCSCSSTRGVLDRELWVLILVQPVVLVLVRVLLYLIEALAYKILFKHPLLRKCYYTELVAVGQTLWVMGVVMFNSKIHCANAHFHDSRTQRV